VWAGELPELKRSRALGVAFELVRDTPPLNGPTLIATTGQLLQAGDIRVAKEARGRLVTTDGRPMPVGVASRWEGSVAASLQPAPTVTATAVAKIISNLAEAQVALLGLLSARAHHVQARLGIRMGPQLALDRLQDLRANRGGLVHQMMTGGGNCEHPRIEKTVDHAQVVAPVHGLIRMTLHDEDALIRSRVSLKASTPLDHCGHPGHGQRARL
jgi:hypothetical protein